MKKVMILSLILFAFTACHSQSKNDKNKVSKSKSVKTPHGTWTVHKQYDANGNLIRKDSTYSYSHATINGKEVPQAKLDSLFSRFHPDMRANFGNMNIPNGFDTDSLENSFFNQNFGNLQKMHERMMKQMQRMQQEFMQQNRHQDWIPKEKEDSVSEKPSRNEAYEKHQI